jgi:hypothetical protein
LVASLGVVAICLGQGAMFPNVREKDPDALSTTPAGLVATFLGAAYITIIARYLFTFLDAYYRGGFFDPLPMFGMLVVAIAAVGLYWAIAVRVIEKKEFPG